MEVTSFWTGLLGAPKEAPAVISQPDDLDELDAAWAAIQETLERPNERELVRGISSTDVPKHLRHIVDAVVYESNRSDDFSTGACLEYVLRHDVLANLVRLSEVDRPHGIKGEVVRALNSLVVLLSDRFLMHNAVHRPLRRLLRSCVGDEPEDQEPVDGTARLMGAAGMDVKAGSQEELEGDLVDLMCILCSKIRAYPALLLIFFHDKSVGQPDFPQSHIGPDPSQLSRAFSPTPTTRTISTTRSSGKPTARFEFLLFSYLLRFVHREGRTGDFARAGLLFLFDVVFLPADESEVSSPETESERIDPMDPLQDAREALAAYILDGDFPEVMAAGLGAIYSLLPTKLVVPTLAQQTNSASGIPASTSGGMHLGLHGDSSPGANTDQEHVDIVPLRLSTDEEVRKQLEMLLKLLGFLQDILFRGTSASLVRFSEASETSVIHALGSAISDAALDAMEVSFLDNVLYPSILECSNTDGSSVAVMTYIEVLFSQLDDGPLLQRMVSSLLDLEGSSNDDQGPGQRGLHPTTAKATRRSDADLPATEIVRFTVKDLILENLRSSSPVASAAALRLLRTVFLEHCSNATQGLLTVHMSSATLPLRSIFPGQDSDVHLGYGAQERDARLLYGNLVNRLDPSLDNVEQSGTYAGYLADVQMAIQDDRCFLTGQLSHSVDRGQRLFSGYESDTPVHRIATEDPLIQALLGGFYSFLTRTPGENLALTGAISALAVCRQRSLVGWLIEDPPPLVSESSSRSSSPPASSSTSSTPGVLSNGGGPEIMGLQPALGLDESTLTSGPGPGPALYEILLGLTRQIATVRRQITDFDRLLSQRRQGLLFADHLDEAMHAMLDVDSTLFAPSPGAGPGSGQAITPSGRGKRPGMLGSIASFLSPNRRKPPSSPGQPPATPPTPRKGLFGAAAEIDASPFKSHYAALDGQIVTIQGLPSRYRADTATAEPVAVAENGSSGTSPGQVSLSLLLDNCVVLEEFLKEIVGVITARRALGIDEFQYR